MATTEEIKALRDKTGISVMQVKKALEEAGGDAEKALVLLRKKGADVAAKKADRALGSGVVAAYVHSNSRVGSMILLSSETDFVANNEEFKTLAYDIAMHAAALNPEYIKASDIPEEDRKKAAKAFELELKGKPKEMHAKILEGKLAAYFGEKTLLDQPFIKDSERKISSLIEGAIQKFGEKIEVSKMARFSV